jgi:site-specific DNA recombinase
VQGGAIKLDGYTRVSRVRGRGGESFISPDVQREQIERYAALRGFEIVGWETDLDQSGGTIDRPGFQRVLGRIESGATEGLIVAKLDRFARSIVGAYQAIERIQRAGGTFVSVADQFDLSSSTGKLMFTILAAFAQFERDRITETWATAQERAVARGVHIASRPPTGYTRGEDGRLVPHPRFAPAVAEAFRMRAAGASWRALCDHLDKHGVIGPYGASSWQPRAAQGIIANRAYLGEARSGRHANREAHEAIVDHATWEAAQVSRGAPTPRSDAAGALVGLLRCAGCRYLMKPDWVTLRSGERGRMYRCRGRHAAGVCHARSAVLASVIEPWVEERFFEAVGDLHAHRVETSPDIEDAERAVHEAAAELVAFRDNERIVGALGEDRYVAGLDLRARRLHEAELELVRTRSSHPMLEGRSVESLRALWPELETGERRQLLQAVFDAVFLRRGRQLAIADRAHIVVRGDAPDDWPRRGRRVPLRPFLWPIEEPPTSAAALKDGQEGPL